MRSTVEHPISQSSDRKPGTQRLKCGVELVDGCGCRVASVPHTNRGWFPGPLGGGGGFKVLKGLKGLEGGGKGSGRGGGAEGRKPLKP